MVVRVLQGHVVDVLATLAPESCHVVCTSPPYWLLRSYGTPPQIWPNPDGTPLCRGGIDLQTGAAIDGHEWVETVSRGQTGGLTPKQLTNPGSYAARQPVATCSRCGCWRGELGSEPTVERYIADLVYVFRSVRRVLRRDGTCWVNLAGSYFNNPGGQNGGNGMGMSTLAGGRASLLAGRDEYHQQVEGAKRISQKAVEANRQAGRQDRTRGASKDYWLKPLDFVDVPGLFAHAMVRDGWWWRADIALVKRSPLPESVSGWRWERCRVKTAKGEPANVTKQGEYPNRTVAGFNERYFDGVGVAEWADCPGCPKCAPNDGLILRRGNGRPTRAWERLLVFAKAPGAYWDTDAVREEPTGRTGAMRFWKKGYEEDAKTRGLRQDGERVFTLTADVGRNMRDWQFWPTSGGGLGSFTLTERAAVPADEAGHDTVRIPSADCPVHGHPQSATVERGASGAARRPRKVGTAAHPSQAPLLGLLDTPPRYTTADSEDARAATDHSSALSRTALVPLSGQVDSASAETQFHTADTSTSPSDEPPHLDTSESNTSAADVRDGLAPQSQRRIAGNVSPGTCAADEADENQSLHSDEYSISAPDGSLEASPSEQTPCRTPGKCTCQYYTESQRESSHFASYPQGIPSLAIRAGTSEGGCCAKCGAPLARVVEHSTHFESDSGRAGNPPGGKWAGTEQALSGSYDIRMGPVVESRTLAWRPTCSCKDAGPPIPATVLDVFVGAGTTLLAANQLGRDGIGIDLKESYITITQKRLARVPLAMPLFALVPITSVEPDDAPASG